MNLSRFSAFFLIVLIVGCKAYKQDIMFQTTGDGGTFQLAHAVDQAERNYQLQVNDLIQFDVFTNGGVALVDPNFEFFSQGNNQQQNQNRDQFQYLVQTDGSVKFPEIGKKVVAGLTVDEAEQLLEQAYNIPYVETFVKITLLNRRVVVLGGEGGQVIPIDNDNTSLAEVLAVYGGLNLGSKAANIRVIRGDLRDPQIFEVDLSTIDGMRATIVDIEPGDIIYIEPWRRPWLESISDVAPVLSLTSSVLTLIVVIQNL